TVRHSIALHDALPISTELKEHVAVLLELRIEDLRRGRERCRWTIFAGFPRFSRLPRFRTELGSRLRARLGPSRGLRLGKFGLGLVDLAGEAVHLDVLVCWNLVPQALHDLLLLEF